MHFSSFFAAWMLHALVTECADTVTASWSAADLKSKLSRDANVVSPSDSDWATLVARASYPRIDPTYKVVVEVATEADVQATVTYANKYGIPFLAVSGTHGWPKTLNGLKGGIQISLRKLNRSSVDEGGNTATIGGGSLQWEALADLYQNGKQAVTGICECVSVAGPLLGGGHGQLQNQFGFAMDNLVSARVVLANGTIAVASAARNPDLYWALRGAGHNFGIVTSLQVKVYDVNQWTVFAFIFPQEKLEALYTLVNKIDTPKMRPDKLMITGVFARVDAIDPVNPAVIYTVSYEGPKAEMQKFADQFIALGPISTTITENVDYIDLYTVTGNDKDNAVCRKNNNILGAGAALPKWDMQGLRKAYNTFSNYTLDPRFSASAVLLENYGLNAASKIDPKSTALAAEERTRPILVSAIMWYEGDDAKTHDDARKHAKAMKDAFYRGVDASKEKRHAYVNYAYGDEPLAELYGHEQWRLDKLKSLKKAYDPKNAFGFYMPLV